VSEWGEKHAPQVETEKKKIKKQREGGGSFSYDKALVLKITKKGC